MNLLAPYFLLGLISVVIPVWLHLINKENPQVLDFASRMFLEPTPISSHTSKKLQFKKLLLARLAFLTLLVVLFAQPVIVRVGQWLEQGGSLHAVVIDRSFSMRQGDSWVEAIHEARELLMTIPSGDPVLLLAADQRLSIVAEASTDRNSLASALSSLQPGYGRLAYHAMMAQLQSLIDEADLPVKIHLLTDAQNSGMPKNIRDVVPRGVSELNVVTVGSETNRNAYIQTVTAVERQGQGEVRVYIGGLNSSEVNDLSVSLVVGEGDKLLSPLVIDPRGRLFADFSGIPLSRGINRFVARVNFSDTLSADNHFFFGIESGQNHQFYFAGKQHGSTAAMFLQTALSSDEGYFADSQVEIQSKIPDEAVLVIVPDESDLSGVEKSDLEQYTREGGSALIVTGFKPNSASNQGQQLAHGQTLSVGFVDTTHPIILDRALWQEITFFRTLAFTPRETDRVLVALSDGSPFIIERISGEDSDSQGRQIIIVTTLDGTFNDFPTSRIFAPFILQLVRDLTDADRQSGSITSGTRFIVDPGGQLMSPTGKNLVPFAALGDENYIELDEPGVYELRGAERTGLISVNIDRRESLTQRLDSNFILQWQALVKGQSNDEFNENTAASSDIEPLALTRWLLPPLVLLLLFEVLYANAHLGSRRGVRS